MWRLHRDDILQLNKHNTFDYYLKTHSALTLGTSLSSSAGLESPSSSSWSTKSRQQAALRLRAMDMSPDRATGTKNSVRRS